MKSQSNLTASRNHPSTTPGRTLSCPRWLTPALLAATLLSSPVSAADSPVEPLRKLRSESATQTAQLQQQGAQLVADYGSFQILTAPPTLAADGSVATADELDVIELNAGPLRTTRPEIQALRQTLSTFEGRRLHLVQFAAPVKPEWHASLVASGVEVVTYVPNNAYLVYGAAAALGQVQTWAVKAGPVQWEGAFQDAFKLHPDVRLTDAKGQARTFPDDLFVIQMVADPKANALTLAAIDVRKLAPILKQETVLNYVNVIVRLPATELAALAAQPEVVSIWPYVLPKLRDERQGQIVAGNLAGTQPSGPGYLGWLASKGFTQAQFAASGFAVDVSDSGLDNGTATPGHFGLYPEGNTGLASRVAYNRLVGTPGPGSTIQGCDGHGTLNSHIIAGYNTFAGFPFQDTAGFSYGLGIAPFVRVGSSVIFDPNSFTSPNYATLQSQAYRDGARISANSWGANTSGGYNTDAQSYDALVRDAQPAGSTVPAAGNQEMVIVFAAGNAGPGASSVGAPGTAKNVITVGAAENVHSHSIANGGNTANGNDGCNDNDLQADSANDMSDFSSRGPCADGRKKPDLVAPGTHITGGVAQTATPVPTGTALACFDATGVCALPGGGTVGDPDNFFPLGQQFYTTSAGTSHSCPAVAGGAALVRQWFINHSQTPPSPALTKAWLMNSARYMDGDFVNDTLPSNVQGLGNMNLGMAFDDTQRIVQEQSPTDKFTASGQTRAVVGSITDPSRPFRITLAWTDAPGSTVGSAYKNNLDLVVTVGGVTYRGNVFSGANSTPGGTADSRNNVESVFLPAGVIGNFIATVTAANIVADGVPNDADLLDQDFALVVYNAQTREAPVISTDGAAVTAESCVPGNGGADPGEVVSVAFTLRNVGTGPSTNLVATLLATGGVLTPSAPQTYGALVAGAPGVAQTFSFRAVGACGLNIHCTLALTDGGSDLGTVTFPLRLGGTISASDTFSDPTVITIPDFGAGAPYPALLPVTGLAGTVSKVTATVYGFSHEFPGDVDILLVSPSGATVMLLSRAGGGTEAVGADLTFDDAAATGVTSPIVSGVYQPTATGTGTLPAPAPARPYGTTMAALNGGGANGLWRLFVNDHGSGDQGSISGGWSLTVTTEQGDCCYTSGQADLGILVVDQPDPAAWESDLTYTISITNQGAGSAVGVMLTNWLPSQVSFVSATASQGTVANQASVVVASLGVLNVGDSATVQIVATVNYGTSLTNRVAISTATFDYDLGNNEAVTVTAVNPPVLGFSSRVYLTAESCGAGNGVMDPGENVTVQLVLQNTGTRKTTNVVVMLQPTGGVTSPSAAQNYGAMLPGGPPVTNAFSFSAQRECGGLVLTTFDITDSATPLLVVSNQWRVGVPVTTFTESFDSVTVPALPGGWTADLIGTGPTWQTSGTLADTLPNSAFVADPATASDKRLISPIFFLGAQAQLIFQHSFNTEACCDGGTLDISVNGGPFLDIITAGGSFVSGGYSGFGNWWAGNSGGFITTVANLPVAAVGQNVQLRWQFTSDSSVSGTGWYVDSISLLASYDCCVAEDLSITATAGPNPVIAGDEWTITLGTTNSGPSGATGVTISNFLPASVTFVSAAVSQGTWSRSGNLVVADLGNVSGAAGAGLSIVVQTTTAGSLTNLAIVKRDGGEAYLANNTVQSMTVVQAPVLALSSQFYLMAESCGVGNGVIDPGEQVTVNLVLQNTGTRKTTNLVVSLQSTGGVSSPSSAQSYGALLPGGPPVTNAFTFVAQGDCGGLLVTSYDVTDNAAPLVVLTQNFSLGVSDAPLAENFDGVTVPALPSGWTAALTGTGPTWQTTSAAADTLPNAAFVANPSTTSDKQLLSPTFLVSALAPLSFRHSYSTELGYDGSTLEISIAGGGFVDLVTAGGSFVSGGYDADGWWSGSSGGFITTVANLPAAAVGQNVQLRWHFTSDSSFGGTGWYVDSIVMPGGYTCCVGDDLTVGASASPSSVMAGENLTYTLSVSNSGPATATGVTISNLLPVGIALVSATPSQGTWSRAGRMVVANLGDIPDRGSATLDIVIKTWAAGTVINTAVVRRDGVEANLANNAVLTVTTVDAPSTNFTFLASGAVSIPTAGSGPGTPYPSTLLVAGVAGPVTKVTATLSNLNHTYPDDLDILLVGPGGQKTMLMSDCGGSLDLVNVTLTFNDQAPGTLPDASLIGSGTYRPSDYARGETLPVPAPAGPYGTNLATYQNLNANGTWHLFVADDASGDGGSLAAGWFLTITASLPPLPGMALHAVMGSANTVHLSFDSLAGMTYVMDRKKSLDQPNWESMPPVVGTGATMTITDSLGGQTQQVYRLRME